MTHAPCLPRRHLRWLAPLAGALLCIPMALAQEPAAPTGDDGLRALIQEAGDAESNDGADLVTVFRRTRVEVEPTGLSHIHNHELIKCLSDKGATQLARLRLDFDPMSNLVEIRAVRILRQDGSVEEVAPGDAVDLPQPQWGIYWGAQMKLLALPRLAIGDAVEIKSYMKGFLIAYLDEMGQGASSAAAEEERYVPPMRGHFYDVVYFQESHPVKLRHYQVVTPRDKPVQFEVYGGEVASYVTYDDEFFRYSFWKEDLPAYHAEPRAAASSDLAPKVVLATVRDWPAKSRWFAQVNADQFVADEAIQEKVAELTGGLKTDDEKIAAIVHWVADNIRYSGVSMGRGEGYTLHPGPMIYENRSGVCKDKAGMAITMLRAAGYDSWPAMTMAGSRVERIPADQFNHCITTLRREDGSFQLLDPTWVPLSTELWSSAEGEQHYVIGTPEGEELARTPTFAPEDNKLRLESEATLEADGALSGTLVISAEGFADQRLRRLLAQSVAPRDRQSVFTRIVERIAPGAEVEKVALTTDRLIDLSAPLRIEVAYRIPRFAMAGKDALYFSPPTARHLVTDGGLAPYLGVADLEERTQPVFLWAPRMREVRETLQLPPGYQVARLPEDRSIDGEAASLAVHAESEGRRLAYTYRLVVKQRTIQPEDYGVFRRVVQEALDLPEDLVVLERR